jgi:hypothetical protein
VHTGARRKRPAPSLPKPPPHFTPCSPYGAAGLLATYDEDGPALYLVEPSGVAHKYHGTAVGASGGAGPEMGGRAGPPRRRSRAGALPRLAARALDPSLLVTDWPPLCRRRWARRGRP